MNTWFSFATFCFLDAIVSAYHLVAGHEPYSWRVQALSGVVCAALSVLIGIVKERKRGN